MIKLRAAHADHAMANFDLLPPEQADSVLNDQLLPFLYTNHISLDSTSFNREIIQKVFSHIKDRLQDSNQQLIGSHFTQIISNELGEAISMVDAIAAVILKGAPVQFIQTNEALECIFSASYRLTPQEIGYITLELRAIFNDQIADLFCQLFIRTPNINADHEGWTLLHHCVYRFSYICERNWEGDGQRLIRLMQYILSRGADREKSDNFGRTPLYFASVSGNCPANMNKQYWELLSPDLATLNPVNPNIQPLHVVASCAKKDVSDLIERGADPYSLDMHQRTPLHCAVINNRFSAPYSNVRCLMGCAPLSLEFPDSLGFYPLYYAALFGEEDEFFDLVLEKSPRWVVLEVMEQLAEINIDDEGLVDGLAAAHKINDPIYSVQMPFRIIFGGVPPRKEKKKARAEKLEAAEAAKKPRYEKDGVFYDIYSDKHGHKHIINPAAYRQHFSSHRDFAKSTLGKGKSAKFLPEVFSQHTYEEVLASCIKEWVDQGADRENPYYDFKKNIGADNGNMTSCVEIYFSANGGAHMRPKYLG